MSRTFVYTPLDDERYVAIVTMTDVTLMTEDILSGIQAWTRGEMRNHVLVDAALLSGISQERFIEFDLSESGCVMSGTGRYVIPSPAIAEVANGILEGIMPELLHEEDDVSVMGAFRKKSAEEKKDEGNPAYGFLPIVRWILGRNERQVEEEGGERMGETKLQCLLFLMQRGYITATGRPLFGSDFVRSGGMPVVREVRKAYGRLPFIPYDGSGIGEVAGSDESILEAIFDTFSIYSGVGLKRMLESDPSIAGVHEGDIITKAAVAGG